MQVKFFILLAFVVMLIHFARMEGGFQCYECGYMEDHTGRRDKIPCLYEDIPFCGNDTINENTTPKDNVTEVFQFPANL